MEPVVDHYTGIGELTSVYELTRLFDAHRANFVLKRSLLVTWDEAKQRNLIFIGSPAENPSLNALPSLSEFTMVAKPESAGFINDHPRARESWRLYSRPEHPLTMDYAVIALMPGVQSGKRTLMFSGLTTLGTQAAVEFASHKDTLAELSENGLVADRGDYGHSRRCWPSRSKVEFPCRANWSRFTFISQAR